MKRLHRRRSGYAMVVVMLLILTTTAMAAVQMRYLNSALRIEQARQRSEAESRGPRLVLAIACARLEAGDPPSSGVSYQYTNAEASGSVVYRVSFQETSSDRWTITANPDPTAITLPTLPMQF